MTTATHTKLLQQETIAQLDGTQRVLSFFAPTEETMRALILRAVRSLGIEVSDDELKDRRGRRGP